MRGFTMSTNVRSAEKVGVEILGPMRVSVGAVPIGSVRNRKVLWLLGLLVIRAGRPTSRKWLAGTLWTNASGGVFVLNVTSPEAARDLLEPLPLGVAGMMEFDLIPLGPLTPLRFLMTDGPTS